MKRAVPVITAMAVMLMVVFVGACSKGDQSSKKSLTPTETLKAYIEAAKNKDAAGLKSYLSKGTIEMMEKEAKGKGMSLDDAMKASMAAMPTVESPELGKEEINGDNATVEVKARGNTVKMPLVKEDGAWKVAIDKLMMTMGAGG
ncbi:MAG TPA: DUF2950 family protein [Pyrinomonadaceae bacterium]